MELKLFIAGCIVFVLAMTMQIFKKYLKAKISDKLYQNVYSWLDTIWSALIIASLIMFFFIQSFKIPSGSMKNTLLVGDHLFVNKAFYGFRVPFKHVGKRYCALKKVKRGDIIVFQCPPEALSISERKQGIKKAFIKRCVAVSGDKVEIIDKKLYVNDVFIKESYVTHSDENIFQKFDLFESQEDYQKAWQKGKFTSLDHYYYLTRDNFGPVVVPEGHYMVIGDNRDNSSDSRCWGPLSDKYVKGKALFLYWPITRWRVIS